MMKLNFLAVAEECRQALDQMMQSVGSLLENRLKQLHALATSTDEQQERLRQEAGKLFALEFILPFGDSA
jgi:hypothetical protein